MHGHIFRLAQRLACADVRPVQRARLVEAVALLVDGENIAAEFAVHLLAHAGKYGGVSLRRVYGNWAAPTMQRWQETVAHYNMVPIHQHLPVTGKNGTDIALTVEAMDMFYSGIRRFCLASGDSDYTFLVRQLVERGCIVVVIGRPDTALSLQQASTVFISTEQLQAGVTRGRKEQAAGAASAKPESRAPQSGQENLELQQMLQRAYQETVADTDNGWVALSRLGTILKRIDPTFTAKSYGCPTLKALIRKYAPIFQVQESNGGQAHIKLQEPSDESEQADQSSDGPEA